MDSVDVPLPQKSLAWNPILSEVSKYQLMIWSSTPLHPLPLHFVKNQRQELESEVIQCNNTTKKKKKKTMMMKMKL